ncbi:MAG: adenosine deaminase [Saprospiraceae bacterium]|jgi:adenosine deaminase
MESFISGLPKAELHLHIEGTFEPELMFQLAQRNGIALPYASVDALREAYDFSNLQDFLDIYYQGMNVLHTEQDYFDLTAAYIERVHAQNVKHVEIFFDPQGHLERGIEFKTIIDGIHAALVKGQHDHGISFGIIMCFLRHLDEQSAIETLEAATPFLDKIIGVGLDSSEMGHPPSKFVNVFAKAKALGLKLVAHAGEEGPSDYVWQAINLLNVDRIDHGNTAMQDPRLIQHLVKTQMALTVCPLSNTKLCVVDHMKNHPLPAMLNAGLCVTLNSDDPAYFGGYMNENFNAVAANLPLSRDQLALLSRNSFKAAFISDERRDELMSSLASYMRAA